MRARSRGEKDRWRDEWLSGELGRRQQQRERGEPVDPWLPIYWPTGPKKPAFEDFLRLRISTVQHELEHPGYRDQYLPRLDTAEKVWELLGSPLRLKWEELLTAPLCKKARNAHERLDVPLTAEELRDLEHMAKRALCAAVMCVVRLGEMGQSLTVNKVFDVLALGWSPNFRSMCEGYETGEPSKRVTIKARTAYDAPYSVVDLAARDLLVAGLSFDAIWAKVAGQICEGQRRTETSGRNPLYYITHIRSPEGQATEDRTNKTGPPRSRRVHLHERTIAYAVFKLHTENDPTARTATPGYRLCLTEPGPTREPRQRVAGGRPYMRVAVGDRGEQCLELQQRQVVLLDVRAFQEDFTEARRKKATLGAALFALGLNPDTHTTDTEHVRSLTKTGKPRMRNGKPVVHARSSRATGLYFYGRRHGGAAKKKALALFEQYDQVDWIVSHFRQAFQQVEELRLNRGLAHDTGALYLATCSRYFIAPNGRFQPADLSPLGVTKKRAFWQEHAADPDLADASEFGDEDVAGLRLRWFKAPLPGENPKPGELCREAQPLVSRDISSSQTQILAFFLGSDALQAAAAGATKFQDTLNEKARPLLQRRGTPWDASEIKKLTKPTWMRYQYGSTLHRVVSDLWEALGEDGPRWRVRGRTPKTQKRYATWMAERFIDSIPGIDELKNFARMCKAIGDSLKAEGSREGVVFTSPYDRRGGEPVRVRWNPVERADRYLDVSRHKVIVSVPGRKRNGQLIDHQMDANGDYPVNFRKLKQMLAPCFVHLQDGAFSALVMERLAERGVHTIVGIHDQWLVPAEVRVDGDVLPRKGADVLGEVIEEVGREWFLGLGPLYDDLIQYLDSPGLKAQDKPLQEFAREIKRRWEERKAPAEARATSWPRFRYE